MSTQNPESPYILFVDDEDMTRKTFDRIASQEFRVLLAADVPQAIELLRTRAHEVGVLLTDQRMPGALGVELLEHVREHHPHIVRMLTTAYSQLEDAIAAVNRGEIIRYIEKPWTNIDALLIDLRVAMRFFLLQRDNDLLLQEKMSAKGREADLDRLAVLVAIAAQQPNPQAALIGLEDTLKQLSELRGASSSQVAARIDTHGGPLAAAQQAEFLSCQIASQLPQRDSSAVPAQVAEDRRAVVSSVLAAAACLVQNPPQISIESDREHIVLSGAASCGARLASWVNGGRDQASLQSLADLLRLTFLVYGAGGTLELKFGSDSGLDSISIQLPAVQAGASFSQQDRDWLEDIIILFA